jgi:hypothetical protein
MRRAACLQRAVRSIHGGKDYKEDDYGKNSQRNNRHGTHSGTAGGMTSHLAVWEAYQKIYLPATEP